MNHNRHSMANVIVFILISLGFIRKSVWFPLANTSHDFEVRTSNTERNFSRFNWLSPICIRTNDPSPDTTLANICHCSLNKNFLVVFYTKISKQINISVVRSQSHKLFCSYATRPQHVKLEAAIKKNSLCSTI